MPIYFRTSNQDSFYRQLRFYKFRRIKKAPKSTYYYHEHFKRNQFNEFCYINKIANKRKPVKPKDIEAKHLQVQIARYQMECDTKLHEVQYLRAYIEAIIKENKNKIFEYIDLKSKFQGKTKQVLLSLYTKSRFYDINLDVEVNALIDKEDMESDHTTTEQRIKETKREVPRGTFVVAQQLLFFPTNKRPLIEKITKVTVKNLSRRIMGCEDELMYQDLYSFFFKNKTSDRIANSAQFEQLNMIKAFVNDASRMILNKSSPNYDFIECYDYLVQANSTEQLGNIRNISFEANNTSGLFFTGTNNSIDTDLSVFMTPKRND